LPVSGIVKCLKRVENDIFVGMESGYILKITFNPSMQITLVKKVSFDINDIFFVNRYHYLLLGTELFEVKYEDCIKHKIEDFNGGKSIDRASQSVFLIGKYHGWILYDT
jgi:hypothetical protein